MRHPSRRLALAALFAACGSTPMHAADDSFVVVVHRGLPPLDGVALQRVYTGRMVEWSGQHLEPVNLPPGAEARRRFLERVMQQDEDRYRAYWTVRRHVGKGVPPRELPSAAEVLRFVQATPGAVGYVAAADLAPGTYTVIKP